ncbi:MAG: ribose ABC transporter permease [Spirochaetes bacterium RBG_16_67_19]|nr:MAG: ribose ABC transporter permease [Spirochaetes bacterium RBG_16_67_19]
MFARVLQKYAIYFGFLAIFAVFSVLSPHFLQGQNLSNILVQASVMAIIAIGQTMVIITGGIDLSVGSIVACTSLVSAVLIVDSGMPVPVGLLIALLISLLMGFVNGFISHYGRVPPFITTLGIMSIARGAALALKGGRPVGNVPDAYEGLATTTLFGRIPIFILYIVIAYAIAYFFLMYTRHGRYIYAIGGNRDAARLSGIPVKLYGTLAYVIAGGLAGIGGILLTARLDYASPITGYGYELDAIASSVIGGTSLSGGEGNILGTLLGAVMIVTLKNGLTLLDVSAYYQQITIGVVVIMAVFLDSIKSLRAE